MVMQRLASTRLQHRSHAVPGSNDKPRQAFRFRRAQLRIVAKTVIRVIDPSMRTTARIPRMAEAASKAVVCCYHYPCHDGIFAALAVYLHHQQTGKAVRFVPLTVYAPNIADLGLQGGESVLMCDFAGPQGFVQEVASQTESVIVLDHHKTAVEQLSAPGLPSNVELVLDMNRSGATIALDHFQPTVSEKIEQMFRMVCDADLYRWAVPDSREFHAGFAMLNMDLDARSNPSVFQHLMDLEPDEIIRKGREAVEEERRVTSSALAGAVEVQLGGPSGSGRGWGRCLAVDRSGDSGGRSRSAIGNALAKEAGARGLTAIGIVAYREADMKDEALIKLSLRGVGDEVDTTTVTQAWGGGGHRLASSCIVPTEEWLLWKKHAA